MAKRYDDHKARQNVLTSFGKELVRRSGAHCELCDCSGEKLQVHEAAFDNEFTDADHCIFICDTCKAQLENPKRMNVDHLRCLNNSVWSDLPVAQALSLRLLKRIAPTTPWAAALLEEAYFDEDIEQWAAHEA